MVLLNSALIDLKAGDIVGHSGERSSKVYFPIDCVLSVLMRMRDGAMIEAGEIGSEGNFPILPESGPKSMANECFCRIPGTAIAMETALFCLLRGEAEFGRLIDSFVISYIDALTQRAACNRLHTLYERCARWLLAADDRMEGRSILVTHEHLATMLGAQRSGVTIAATSLQRAGLISYARGLITIVDRAGLQQESCECYNASLSS